MFLNMENMTESQAKDENKQEFNTQLHFLSSVLWAKPTHSHCRGKGHRSSWRATGNSKQAVGTGSSTGPTPSVGAWLAFPPGSPRKEHALAYSPDHSLALGPSLRNLGLLLCIAQHEINT
jgi:hypothetical protein